MFCFVFVFIFYEGLLWETKFYFTSNYFSPSHFHLAVILEQSNRTSFSNLNISKTDTFITFKLGSYFTHRIFHDVIKWKRIFFKIQIVLLNYTLVKWQKNATSYEKSISNRLPIKKELAETVDHTKVKNILLLRCQHFYVCTSWVITLILL